jgi:hypothetical protein
LRDEAMTAEVLVNLIGSCSGCDGGESWVTNPSAFSGAQIYRLRAADRGVPPRAEHDRDATHPIARGAVEELIFPSNRG